MYRIKFSDLAKNESLRGKILKKIKSGSVFICPTDTIYGLGCNALKSGSVSRIRKIKKTGHPFSVISPGTSWINANLVVRFPEYLEKLPGPYTFIFEKKRPGFLSHASKSNSLGVRIPDHPFTLLIRESGLPFVSTSVNYSGRPSIKKPDDTPKGILDLVDYIIDAGILDNPPSRIFDLTGIEPREIKRKRP